MHFFWKTTLYACWIHEFNRDKRFRSIPIDGQALCTFSVGAISCGANAQGQVLVDSRLAGKPTPGSALWSGPLPPHSLENVGESDLRAISVELKTISAE